MRIINLLLMYIMGLGNLMQDKVMIRIHPKQLPKNSCKKLHVQAIGPFPIIKKFRPNAYLFNLVNHMNISPIFNVEDLLPYYGTFEPPTSSSNLQILRFLRCHIFLNREMRLKQSWMIKLSLLLMIASIIILFTRRIVLLLMLLRLQKISFIPWIVSFSNGTLDKLSEVKFFPIRGI